MQWVVGILKTMQRNYFEAISVQKYRTTVPDTQIIMYVYNISTPCYFLLTCVKQIISSAYPDNTETHTEINHPDLFPGQR